MLSKLFSLHTRWAGKTGQTPAEARCPNCHCILDRPHALNCTRCMAEIPQARGCSGCGKCRNS